VPEITYKRPPLYPKQLAAFFHDKRYGLIEATTKAGKTVGGMGWLLEKAIEGRVGQNFWWVAPVFPQAEIAYSRMKRGMTPGFFVYKNDTDKRLILPNGAEIWFKSGEKPDNLYGDDVFACVMDEASRMREESYYAVRSTLTATKGQVRIIGNVKGRHNWFYRMSRRAEGGDADMEYHKIIAYDAVEAGVLSAEEIEDAKRNLPEQVFRELYLAEPSDDGGNPFGYSAIQKCIKPLSTLAPKYGGIDLAKSNDWTVITQLDSNGDVCRFDRFQKPWMDTIDFILQNVKVPSFVDSTGVGDPILEALQKKAGLIFEGYHFSSTSKQQLMEGLAVSIQQGKIGFPDGLIPTELEQFEYELTRTGVRYSAPAGLHDDCVCSLAMAERRRMLLRPGANILDYLDAEAEKQAASASVAAKGSQGAKTAPIASQCDFEAGFNRGR